VWAYTTSPKFEIVLRIQYSLCILCNNTKFTWGSLWKITAMLTALPFPSSPRTLWCTGCCLLTHFKQCLYSLCPDHHYLLCWENEQVTSAMPLAQTVDTFHCILHLSSWLTNGVKNRFFQSTRIADKNSSVSQIIFLVHPLTLQQK